MCTGIRFTSTDGAMYLGRNLDWSTPFGEHIVITPKGYPLAKAFPEESTTKPAGHAIIGMGITDQGYPLYFDCGNDAGLAVAGLNFPGYAQYEEAPVRGKTNVAAYEFPAWITSNQIEAARIAMTRYIKRGGQVWIKIFPDKPVTKKPLGTRMGSGKGAPEYWVAVVKPGRVLFEIAGVPEETAREAMRLAMHKLPIKCKFVKAEKGGEQ